MSELRIIELESLVSILESHITWLQGVNGDLRSPRVITANKSQEKIGSVYGAIRRMAAGETFAELLPLFDTSRWDGWRSCWDVVSGAQMVAIGIDSIHLLTELNSLEHWIDDQRAAEDMVSDVLGAEHE